MNLQESGEMYLEAIYVLKNKNSSVRAIDVSDYFGYSRPSVSRGLSILKKAGFIYSDDNNFLHLTEIGLSTAIKIYDRHIILTKFLKSMGINEDIASNDACKMEHIISDETFLALKKYVDNLN